MHVARFELEAKTLASLNHANIAHMCGLERSDGDSGLVMELVDGPTLALCYRNVDVQFKITR